MSVSSTNPTDDLPARYQWQAKIGEGRFSTVHHCHDCELDRDVALKIGTLAGRDAIEQRRMQRELTISCRLRHPHIASGLDGFQDDRRVVLVLPLCTGGHIPSRSVSDTQSLRQRLHQMTQVASAVAYSHSRGIAHCDLKPDNILLDERGDAHLSDFGSCQSLRSTNETESSAAVGSPAYLAPEVASGKSVPTVASDVYGLGATLFTILTGQSPYQGDVRAVLARVTTGPFPNARKINPFLPTSIEAIISKACASEPRARYASADAFNDDLRAVLADRPIQARVPSTWNRVQLWGRRNPLAAKLAATLMLLVMLGSIVSTTGWVVGRSRTRTLQASQLLLEQQGSQARQREAELAEILASIEKDQASIEQALAEETRLQSDAAEVGRQAKQQAELAEQKLDEAKQLVSKLASLKDQQSVMETQLESLDEITQRRANYLAHLDRRVALNGRFKTDSRAQFQKESIENIPSELRGFAAMHATAQRATDEFPQTRIDVGLDSPPTRIVWSEDGHDIAMAGEFDFIKIVKDTYFDGQESSRWSTVSIPWIGRDAESRLMEFAPRSGDNPSNQLLTAERITDRSYRFRLLDYRNEKILAEKDWNDFDGRIHAIRQIAGKTWVVLRSDRRTRDLQWVNLADQTVRWSCRADRAEHGLTFDSTKSLYPYFVDVGTNRYRHLVFASSPEPVGVQATPIVLHSFDWETTDAKQFATSLNLSYKTLANWPTTWQLSDETVVGCGFGELSTSDPAPISAAPELPKYKRSVDRYSYGMQVHHEVQGWLDLNDQVSLDRFAGYLGVGFDRNLDGGSGTRSRIVGPAIADRVFGQVRFRQTNNTISVYDLITRQRIWQTLQIPGIHSITNMRFSPSGHQAIATPSRSVAIITFGRDRDVTTLDPKVALDRLVLHFGDGKEKLNAGSVMKTSEEAKPSEPSLASKAESSERIGLTFNSKTCQVGVGAIDFNFREPATIECIVKINSAPKQYAWIAFHPAISLQVAPDGRIELTKNLMKGEQPLYQVAGTQTPVFGKWLHLAGCWDGKDTIAFFVDGERIGVQKVRSDLEPMTGRYCVLGTTNPGVNPEFQMQMDAFRCSNKVRYPVNFSTIENLHADHDTVLLYQLNEGSGNKTFNEAGMKGNSKVEHPSWFREDFKTTIPIDIPSKFSVHSKTTRTTAIHFDAVNQHLKLKPWSSSPTDPFTVEAVVFLDSLPTDHYLPIVHHPRFSFRRFYFQDLSFRLEFQPSSGGKLTNHEVFVQTLPMNRWTHLAGTWDGKTSCVFVDGIRKAQEVCKVEPSSKPMHGPIQVGGAWNKMIQGSMAGMRLSDKVIYTSDFTPEFPLTKTNDTIVLLKMDEGQGTMVKDSSGNGFDGIVKESQWVAGPPIEKPADQPTETP